MTELIAGRIKAHAEKLGLLHLAASLEQLVKRADAEQLGYLDFLDLIVEEELGIRDGRRFRQGLRLSKLPHHKTLEEFEFSFQPDLDVRKIKDLATLSFIETKSNAALLERGRFHHVAMFYGVPQHNIDAAEMFREYGIPIECGPDKHGITQGSFLYVFEPGGNRVELFADTGILQFEPDYETRVWSMAELDNGGLAVGGAKLPWETYFTYGTPNKVPLGDHRTQFANAGPPPPPAVAAAEGRTPDALDQSVHVTHG